MRLSTFNALLVAISWVFTIMSSAEASLVGTDTVDWSAATLTSPSTGSVGRNNITVPSSTSSVRDGVRFTVGVGASSFSIDVENLGIDRDIFDIDMTLRLRDLFWAPDGSDITGVTKTGGGLSTTSISFSEQIQPDTWTILVVFDLFDLLSQQSNSASFAIATDQEQSVPEPGTLALFGIGVVGLGLARRRRKTA